MSFLVPEETGLLEGIGLLPLLLTTAVFLYFVTFHFPTVCHSGKNVDMGFHMFETERKLPLEKLKSATWSPKPESDFPLNQDLYMQLERQN